MNAAGDHPDERVVEEIYEAMASRAFDRLFELVHEDVVITQDPALPWGGRFEGHDGLATFALVLTGTIESQVTTQAIAREGRPDEPGDVVQCGHTRGTVVATGVPFDVAEIHRWTIRDGRAVRAHFTIETAAMLTALGAEAETCPVCGFVWSAVAREEVGARVVAATRAVADELRSHSDGAVARRPEPTRWSALEYAAHMRDALYHLRDRFVIGLAEDAATFKPLHRDLRVELGLYRDDRREVVATELELAADLFARTFAVLDDAQLARPILYTYPTEQVRTLLWMGQHVVHEMEHHRGDVEAGLRAG